MAGKINYVGFDALYDLDKKKDQISPKDRTADQEFNSAPQAESAKSIALTLPVAESAQQSESATETDSAPQAELKTAPTIGLNHASQAESAKQTESSYSESIKQVAGYTPIPNTVLDGLLPQLSNYEQLVYLHLFRLSHGFNKQQCTISMNRLSQRTDVSERQLYRALERLYVRGLVKKVGFVAGKGTMPGVIFEIINPVNSATQADSAKRAKSATQTDSAYTLPNKEEFKKKISKSTLKNIISQIRHLYTGSPLPPSELAEMVKNRCARDGKIIDPADLNELLG